VGLAGFAGNIYHSYLEFQKDREDLNADIP
jgi:hypothetical protein